MASNRINRLENIGYSALAVAISPIVLVSVAGYFATKPVNRLYQKLVVEPHRQKDLELAKRNANAYSTLSPDDGSIRLVELLPGAGNDPILANTQYGKITSSKYEALSYAWGDPQLSASMSLDSRSFAITENLHLALTHLRLLDRPRMLWVDAICINQADNAEREQQVSQMYAIYKHASTVLIWLGIAPRGTASAFAPIKKKIGEFTAFEMPTRVNKGTRAHAVLFELISRSWWQRTWVVQELVAAKKVQIQCGPHKISLLKFDELIHKLEVERTPDTTMFPSSSKLKKEHLLVDAQRLIHLRDRKTFNSNPEHGLLSLAYQFRRRQVSDGRDKLYALLGLLNNKDEVLITPDYTLDEEVVFKRFAKAWINHYKRLDIFAVPSEDETLKWYPSWSQYSGNYSRSLITPFWDIGLDPEIPPPPWGKNNFSAAGHTAVDFLCTTNNDIISLRGFTYDTVTAVGMSCEFMLIRWKFDYDACMGDWQRLTREVIDTWDSSIEDKFNLTTTAGLFKRPHLNISDYRGDYTTARNAACKSRRFFVTTKGMLGLGPTITEPGDQVCMLMGAPVPFLLRESATEYISNSGEIVPGRISAERSSEKFSEQQANISPLQGLVGEVYIHDIMFYDGDVVKDAEQGKIILNDYHFA
ncbi:heterokaryon incompatibility protein-domain-containing protein [Bisporella sp. PMI_857]|nr:heterokaryon incompatibility protein-domain-containing protein [Bisporella sp. PMI_857]